MNINTILYVILIIGQVSSFLFLREQIKSKNKVIDDLKTLVETMDIKRLTDYFKTTEELRNKALTASMDLLVTNWLSKTANDFGGQFNDMANYVIYTLKQIPEDGRKEFISKNLPNCIKLFESYFPVPGK